MKLLFLITKGVEDAIGAVRTIQLAALTSEQGHHVEVFLLGEAVQWARGITVFGHEGLAAYLDMLKSTDHPVMVCMSCAEKRLIAREDLMEGTVLTPMPVLAEKIASPDYKVITF
jgi:sulfur relay (sulfurtransferase) complex TusBCD TusD component (DsrE family)|uniref:Sulfur reduction protein DsrE n=1 Tax=Desulfobacca acetoxidans TaxID=60893 RepID=A0A7V6DNW0_9BACT